MTLHISKITHYCQGKTEVEAQNSIFAPELPDPPPENNPDTEVTWRNGNEEGIAFCPYCGDSLPLTLGEALSMVGVRGEKE